MYPRSKVCHASPPYPVPAHITKYDPRTGSSTLEPPPVPIQAYERCWYCGHPWIVHSHYSWTRRMTDDEFLTNPAGCTVCQSIEELRREFYVLPDPEDDEDEDDDE